MTTIPTAFQSCSSAMRSRARLAPRLLDPLRRSAGRFATLAIAGLVALASTVSAAAAGTCPADLNSDGVVNGADLGSLLTGWGQPGPTDIDGNGTTDGADLGALLTGWGACPKPSPTIFTGIVVLSDGTPVPGAVVVTDLGGTAATGKAGDYELSLPLESSPASATVTAVASISGATYEGSAVVGAVALGELNEVDPIVLSPQASCSGGYAWLPGIGNPGMNGFVFAMTVFDDGTGPALYAGGDFTIAGGVAANRIARWDGAAWSSLGSGVNDEVLALAAFDDGTGPALYAGGEFTTAGGVAANHIARWDGAAWSALGGGMDNRVRALAVFDSGAGSALYAGGSFTTAGDAVANYIARWNGAAWSPLRNGMDDEVLALTVFDSGSGPALYAGGFFFTAGGVDASCIARWNGNAWSSLGSGIGGVSVDALAAFDDGTGPALYAGGSFTSAGEVAASRIARWNGTGWSSLGSGVNSVVRALAVLDEGTGPALFAGGSFGSANGNRISRWNGTSWSPLGSGADASVRVLAAFDDGTGPSLFAGGFFGSAGGVFASSIAEWGCVD